MKDFTERYDFEFDEFQVTAASALRRGESVLVAAPTGAGKTVVGEYAVWLALTQGGKVFYTTPLKALSNQKFNDLVSDHGAANVGLLTGDNSINPTAPVVVMTTEVLRNMIYERADLLEGLHYVVLDEVHYLQDRYRGAVWEEVIIHLPMGVKIVSLSATVSNAEEFAGWIQTVRGRTTVIIEEDRPVKLVHHYYVDGALHPMFIETGGRPAPNPQIRNLDSVSRLPAHRRRHSGGGSRGRRPFGRGLPLRTDVAASLKEAGMLPAIYFIFSRKGCDAAVQQCMRERFALTTASERAQIRETARRHCSYLDPSDLDVLEYEAWIEALLAGIAAHHAGLIPAFKETVEELFQTGLVKIVFATETLSLGINMPARTVVIESLNKFTGERHEMLTAGQFTQLTGRAGRRGIDSVGHAVVPRQREIPFQQIAGLASTRTYPLVSSFQPSYNMASNLVRNYTRGQAEQLLKSSFAQYHADKNGGFGGVAAARGYESGAPEAANPPRSDRGAGGRAQKLTRRFDRILGILEELGYLEDFTLTEKGWILARIYNENDLLIAEVLSRGWLDELNVEELAAIVSSFVFESRGPYETAGDLPTATTKRVYGKVRRLEQRLKRTEARVGLELTRGTEAGFAFTAFDWCHGDILEDVLEEESTPGDFIRSCKQSIDLLRQISQAAGAGELSQRLTAAAEQMNRGVIAYTGVLA